MAGIYDRVMLSEGVAFSHAPSKEDPFVYMRVDGTARIAMPRNPCYFDEIKDGRVCSKTVFHGHLRWHDHCFGHF